MRVLLLWPVRCQRIMRDRLHPHNSVLSGLPQLPIGLFTNFYTPIPVRSTSPSASSACRPAGNAPLTTSTYSNVSPVPFRNVQSDVQIIGCTNVNTLPFHPVSSHLQLTLSGVMHLTVVNYIVSSCLPHEISICSPPIEVFSVASDVNRLFRAVSFLITGSE
jgi:hypothetical protein